MTGPGLPLGRDSVSWRVAPSGFLGSSRALLLQTAHPLVAAGVAQHSAYRDDALGRGLRTFDVVLRLAFGTPADSAAQADRLTRRHRPVVGTAPDGRAYDARDPALARCVWATLVDTALLAHERLHGPLSPDDRRRYYEEQKRFGLGCGLAPEDLPASLDDLHGLVDRVVAEDLAWTREGEEVARATFHPALPVLGPVVGAFLRWTAAALFPPRVRELYGLAWSERDERRFDRFCRVLGVADRLVPAPMRSLPLRLVVDGRVLERLARRVPAPPRAPVHEGAGRG